MSYIKKLKRVMGDFSFEVLTKIYASQDSKIRRLSRDLNTHRTHLYHRLKSLEEDGLIHSRKGSYNSSVWNTTEKGEKLIQLIRETNDKIDSV